MAPPCEDWGSRAYPPALPTPAEKIRPELDGKNLLSSGPLAAVPEPSAVHRGLCPPLESADGQLKRI